jgi:hypothetical protein
MMFNGGVKAVSDTVRIEVDVVLTSNVLVVLSQRGDRDQYGSFEYEGGDPE